MSAILEAMTSNAALLAFTVAIPLFGAALLPFFTRQPNTRETVTITTGLVLFFVVLQLFDVFRDGARPYIVLWELYPGFPLALALRPLGLIFAFVASFLWLITSTYAIAYTRHNNVGAQTRFYCCFALSIAATMGIAFSSNLLTLFVFYEALTLATYPLVTHQMNAFAMRGGRIYLGILMGASLGLALPAIVIIWHVTGTLDFTRGGILAGSSFEPWQVGVLLAAMVFGFAKAALMPLHKWLPAAMIAPTPVSALLHAVAVVKAGVFSILTVVIYVFGLDYMRRMTAIDWMAGGWLPYLACFTILSASLVAFRQDNLKRRLAYSTVSHLSYVIVGAALLAPLSLVGAAIHIVAHAFAKITLFFAAGAIYTASGKTEISQLGGIGRSMPWTMTAFAVASLALIGVPPTLGFVSKWYLFLGAMEMRHYVVIATLVLSTLLNAAYLLPIIKTAFFAPQATLEHGEAPKPMLWVMGITAGCTVVLFFFNGWLLRVASEITSQWEPMHLL